MAKRADSKYEPGIAPVLDQAEGKDTDPFFIVGSPPYRAPRDEFGGLVIGESWTAS